MHERCNHWMDQTDHGASAGGVRKELRGLLGCVLACYATAGEEATRGPDKQTGRSFFFVFTHANLQKDAAW